MTTNINATETTQGQIGQIVAVHSNPHEQLYQLKYPHLNIKPGSMVQAPESDPHPLYKNKVRVTLICGCGAEVERATSDLFSFIGCEDCKKLVRKANKAVKKAAEKVIEKSVAEKMAALEAELAALKAEQAAQATVSATETPTEPTTEPTTDAVA